MVIFEVYRFDPEKDSVPHFNRYNIQPKTCWNILDGLFEIIDTQDGSIAFRYACRGAVCGSCAMIINGKPRLACQTLLENIKTNII